MTCIQPTIQQRNCSLGSPEQIEATCCLSTVWDTLPSCLGLEDVMEKSLQTFVRRATSCGNIGFPYEGSWDMLEKLGLTSEGCLTNAGAVLFCNPGRISLVCSSLVAGGGIRLSQKEGMAFGGPIVNLPDQAVRFVKMVYGRRFYDSLSSPKVLIKDGAGRCMRVEAEYGQIALRNGLRGRNKLASEIFSAIVQVLSQVDYSEPGPVGLRAYSDRVEIIAPYAIWGDGAFVWQGETNLGSPGSDAVLLYRNPLVARVLMLLENADLKVQVA